MKVPKVIYHKIAAKKQNTKGNLWDESAKRNSPQESALCNKTLKATYHKKAP